MPMTWTTWTLTPSAWCSTNRENECSIYTIGLIMLKKIFASPPDVFAAVVKLSESGLTKLRMNHKSIALTALTSGLDYSPPAAYTGRLEFRQ